MRVSVIPVSSQINTERRAASKGKNTYVARLVAGEATTAVATTESTLAAVAASARLGASTGNVAGLAAALAVTARASETTGTGSRARGALARKVALLLAVVAGLGLGRASALRVSM